MNPSQLEKLKMLVSSSAILKPSERSEWLALLDLMNDKQLGELEKILGSGREQAEAKISNFQFPISNAKPLIPAATVMQMPKLSHLINLPRMGADPSLVSQKVVMSHDSENQRGKEVAAEKRSQLPTVAKPTSRFGAKLKALFMEKELVSGKPEHELDLPEKNSGWKMEEVPPAVPLDYSKLGSEKSQEKKSLSATGPAFPAEVLPKLLVPPLPPVPRPHSKSVTPPPVIPVRSVSSSVEKKTVPPVLPVFKPLTVHIPEKQNVQPLVRPILSPKEEKKVDAPVHQPVQAPALPEIKNISPATSFSEIPKAVKADATKAAGSSVLPFNPGIHIDKISEHAKAETLSSIKANLKETDLPQTAKPAIVKMNLESLNSLTLLDPKVLEPKSFESLVSAVRQLVAKFGYHEVVFNIEKSPMFKSYITTGTELLLKQQTFELLKAQGESENFLSRQQFEEMADLLRQIQVG